MPVEVRTASCGSAYAEALQDGLPHVATHVAHPVAILIAVEYATWIHHRGIHELRVGVPVPVGDVLRPATATLQGAACSPPKPPPRT